MLPEPFDKILIAIVAALAGWGSGHFRERWKVNAERIKLLRAEYANWFTDQKLLQVSLSRVFPVSIELPLNESQDLHEKMEALASRVESLLRASNLIVLLEKDAVRSEHIRKVTNTLIGLQNGIKTLSLFHQRHNEQLSLISELVELTEENTGDLEAIITRGRFLIDNKVDQSTESKPRSEDDYASIVSDSEEMLLRVKHTRSMVATEREAASERKAKVVMHTHEINELVPNIMKMLEDASVKLSADLAKHL